MQSWLPLVHVNLRYIRSAGSVAPVTGIKERLVLKKIKLNKQHNCVQRTPLLRPSFGSNYLC